MPKRRLGAFQACAKTLKHVYESGACTKTQTNVLMEGRRALLEVIAEVSTSVPGDKNGNKERARRAMQDLLPENDYRESYSEELIKSLADTCITIRSAAENKRIDLPKLVEATVLCECLQDEFSV